MNKDSYQAMLDTVQAFHDKHDFKNTGGEELAYRVALMTEELGEISSCVTKGKDTGKLAEECADLLILVIGTAIAADFDLGKAFWDKMDTLMRRESRMVDGRRKLISLQEITGMEGNVITMQEIFSFHQTRLDSNKRVKGIFKFQGVRPKFIEKFKISGIDVSPDT